MIKNFGINFFYQSYIISPVEFRSIFYVWHEAMNFLVYITCSSIWLPMHSVCKLGKTKTIMFTS